MSPREIEGQVVVPEGARFGIVASRFNHFIVDRLVDGALDAIRRHGGEKADVTIVRVPGAWEIPYAVKRLTQVKKAKENYAIIALGAVIRGSTPHFDYIAAEVTKGIAHVSMDSGVPTAFGVLTTDTIEQAIERAGTKAGNKGWEAALSAIEMLSLSASLSANGY
ncbi:MAG: 6,7-dimethyl-8-ribityllumazine synthase [Myxococcales bacterium]|nr:6,7-dimethyl-8-ribityllumazine synthase [Myxococcales bacterium]